MVKIRDTTKIELIKVEPEYVYVTIPAEYICIYHKILVLLTEYGVEMLKDCKAHCTQRNSNVIECFNMFNAAIAARKLGNTKLAETLIKYIKAKLNQLYKNVDPELHFVFPIDDTGELKAFVSCGELPKFEINVDDGELYKHKYGDGFTEHFHLDNAKPNNDDLDDPFVVDFEIIKNETAKSKIDINLKAYWYNLKLTHDNASISYYIDDINVRNFHEVTGLTKGTHKATIVVKYNYRVKVVNKEFFYDKI